MTQHLHNEKAPKPVASYSQAVRTGDLVFVSGQIPIDKSSGELVAGSIEEATTTSLNNVKTVLEAAGLGLENVIKASVFLINKDDYAGMDRVYADIMSEPFPAREAVFVAGLPKGARIEISVIASSKRS